jgi:predicted Co/Zn/Cd cation transporter (cation efflux family)
MKPESTSALEARSLAISMWGNLFMGVAGIVAAVLSNSTAILMDGLFSVIGFIAAWLGRRILRTVDAAPDKLRPMGYAADEAIFSTFRALSLLGLVLFAVATSGLSIFNHLRGLPPTVLNFGPLFVYFAVVGLTSFLLWAVHRYTWARTGKVSEILRLEAKAALFDAIITAAAGVGLALVFLYRDGFLAPVAPIGDSLVVLILCLAVIGQYRRDLLAGLGELAGVTADPKTVSTARRALRPCLAEDGGTLVDISVMKVGRNYLVTVYYDPERAVHAKEVDALNLCMIRDVREALPGADVLLMISEYPRQWPPELSPF